MYIETSSPRVIGDYADFKSACIDISQLNNPALTFAYHMYGATMGTLDVLVNGDTVWTLSGDQGNQWNEQVLSLSSYSGTINNAGEFFLNGGFAIQIRLLIDSSLPAYKQWAASYVFPTSFVLRTSALLGHLVINSPSVFQK